MLISEEKKKKKQAHALHGDMVYCIKIEREKREVFPNFKYSSQSWYICGSSMESFWRNNYINKACHIEEEENNNKIQKPSNQFDI